MQTQPSTELSPELARARLPELQAQLAVRQSITHFARAGVALVASSIFTAAAAKLFWDSIRFPVFGAAVGAAGERSGHLRVDPVPARVGAPAPRAGALRLSAGGSPGAAPGRSGRAAAAMSAPRGRFIVLEGIDGSGTTTQAARLVASLRAAGQVVVGTREPSEGPMGLLLRQALTRRLVGISDRVLALLFAADRLDHLASLVEPALAEGKVVVSDRYVLSSLAYQGMRLPLAWVEALNAAARPADLTLYLDVDVRTASRRRHVRGGPVELFDADPVQRSVARAYAARGQEARPGAAGGPGGRKRHAGRGRRGDPLAGAGPAVRAPAEVESPAGWDGPALRRSSSATRFSRPRWRT